MTTKNSKPLTAGQIDTIRFVGAGKDPGPGNRASVRALLRRGLLAGAKKGLILTELGEKALSDIEYGTWMAWNIGLNADMCLYAWKRATCGRALVRNNRTGAIINVDTDALPEVMEALFKLAHYQPPSK